MFSGLKSTSPPHPGSGGGTQGLWHAVSKHASPLSYIPSLLTSTRTTAQFTGTQRCVPTAQALPPATPATPATPPGQDTSSAPLPCCQDTPAESLCAGEFLSFSLSITGVFQLTE